MSDSIGSIHTQFRSTLSDGAVLSDWPNMSFKVQTSVKWQERFSDVGNTRVSSKELICRE